MRTSIGTQLRLAFVGLAIVPLLIVGVVTAWQSSLAQRQQALELQAETARRAATEVASFINGLVEELRVVAQVHHLTNLDSETRHSVLSRVSSFGDDFEELALLNSSGQEQVRVSRVKAVTSLDLADRSSEDEFLIPVSTGETYYSPVRFDRVTGEPFMTIAVPLVDVRSGLVDGVLVADVRLKEIWDLIAQIRIGESGSAYIVDDQGRVLAHRDPSVVLRGTQYVLPQSDGIHQGLTGANVVLASEVVPLGYQTLSVVTERPLSEALALTLRTVIITVGLIVAALVCAGLLAFYAARRIVRPIRTLATTAQAISDGDLWRQAETTSHGELAVLGSTFNRMTAQLRAMIESLEERVVERTQELSDANTLLETEMAERVQVEETRRELAVAEERNRLAREIHDTLAQSLFGIMIQMETAGKLLVHEPETASVAIRSARDLARRGVEEARRSIWDLQPRELASGGLIEAVRREVTRAGEEEVQISLAVEGDEPASVDKCNQLAALRIIQEAVTNVRRHAHAKKATVVLKYDPPEIQIGVSDDGVGFDPSGAQGKLSPTRGGFGLTSMQERARLAGGNIEINSAPGVGTQIEVRIPFQTEEGKAREAKKDSCTAILGKHGASEDIRVMIADDHALVRLGIRNMLEHSAGVKVVGEAGDGEDAIEKIGTLAPDVVLMDIQMPKLDGVETVRRLRALGLEPPVILLSVYHRDEYIFEGLRAGARGYLLKDVAEDELVRAIRTVHGGGALLQPVVANRLIERLDTEAGCQLTERELEVLRLLASGARNKGIAEQLLLSINTVKYHIENVYQKLGVGSRTQAVRVASERGLLRT